MDLRIEARWCYVLTVYWIRYTSNFVHMQFLLTNILAHRQVPYGERAIYMAYNAETWHASYHTALHVLHGRAAFQRVGIRQGHVVHIREALSFDVSDGLAHPDVPEHDSLVSANWDCEGPITCHLDRVNRALMTFEIREIFACFTIPDLDVLVNKSTWQQNEIISWVETQGPYNCRMSL